ncbi:MAG: hypothetical protein QXF76_02645 [Candidatus Anstonellales archaeon]
MQICNVHKIFVILTFLIFFIQLNYAQDSYLNASKIGLVGLLASIFIVAVVFMAAKLTNNIKLEIYVKEEAKSIIVTALIIIIYGISAIYLNAVSNAFIKTFYPMASSVKFEHIDSYASLMLQMNLNNSIRLSEMIYTLVRKLGLESSKSLYCSFLGVGYMINVCSIYSIPLSTLDILHSTITMNSWLLSTLIGIMEFFKRNGLLIFLSGIIARTFSFTRGAGNALIAIFIGFSLIMPLTIIGYNIIYNEVKQAVANTEYVGNANPNIPPLNQMKVFCGLNTNNFSYILSYQEFDSLRGYSCEPRDYSLSGKVNDVSKFVTIQVYEPLLFEIYFFYMLMPAFTFLITFGSIHSISRMIGIDIEVFRLERIT